MEGEHDRGQATPLLVAGIGLAAMLLVSLAPMGRALAYRAQARTAADAAALAGAAEGQAAAEQVAAANGAEVVSYETAGDEVTVEVAVGEVNASGRARRHEVPTDLSGGGGGADAAGLTPGMQAALSRAERLLGQAVPISSGFRSRAQQEALWARRGSNPYPVARPGRSMHERGLAVDVPRAFVDDLLTVAAGAGLCQPLPATDPVHFVLCGSRGR